MTNPYIIQENKIYVDDRLCPIQDLRGKKFGKLLVVSYSPKRIKPVQWVCVCECGKETIVISTHLKNGNTKSCGCNLNGFNIKHGHKGRKYVSVEYRSWLAMKDRCYRSGNVGYRHYGGRGIKVCDRWLNCFENFLEDMGNKPSPKHSLDRYPNMNGDYEPSNCRWANSETQNSNTRRNRYIEYNGENKIMAEWARLLKITQGHLSKHLVKKTFKETVDFFRKKKKINV